MRLRALGPIVLLSTSTSLTYVTQDQVHQRSFAVEPLTAVAATADGLYCAAGGVSGSIYVWEVSSGRLLRSWPAHYKVGRVYGGSV